jgi:hypothetical protein
VTEPSGVLSLGILTQNMAADGSMGSVLFVRFSANPGRALGRAAGDFLFDLIDGGGAS